MQRHDDSGKCGSTGRHVDVAMPRPDLIARWHDRIRQLGIHESGIPDFCTVGNPEIRRLIECNRLLYAHALAVMETLYEQIQNTHNMVILTDGTGLIMHSIGDDDFLAKANRVALRPGVNWSEQHKGTNAIGTALVEARPTVVHANEHFLRVNRFLTCSCSPIVDACGKILGALDVSGDQAGFQSHTLALVRMSAQMIENHLFADAFAEAVRIHFHARPDFIGTLVEGIVAFGAGGRFLAANRSAEFQLGLTRTALQTHTLSSLFGLAMSALYDHYRSASPGLLTLCLDSGVTVHARAAFRMPSTVFATSRSGLETTARVAETPPEGSAATKRATRACMMRDLNTGDPQIAAVIEKVGMVKRHDISILILGETGTGKELLAQSIHNESPRRDRPFVALNCASIPETLIEAELFGYEEGAFTGARKRGSVGKMQIANGGTFFLDEIGDMPLNLQARLLRVLQERMVTPLGSTKSIPVNVAVICATNRNLRDMLSRGEFREDLYYRLNGLVVRLPPLRERTDLEAVIDRILQAASDGSRPATVSPEVLALFRSCRWPGNIRQLSNLLRTATAMASDDGGAIQIQHLPDDFLDDLQPARAFAYDAPGPDAGNVRMSRLSRRGPAQDEPSRAPAAVAPHVILLDPVVRMEDVQFSAISVALKQHHGNVSAAARALGVSRNTIYRKIVLAERQRRS